MIKFKELYEQIDISKTLYHGSPYDFSNFDMSKIGSAQGDQKYGYGIYLTDNKKLAIHYAIKESLPKDKNALNLYTVKCDARRFFDWNDQIHAIYQDILDSFEEIGMEGSAEEMRENGPENGYEMMTFKEFYDTMSYDFEDEQKGLNKFLIDYINIYGTYTGDHFYSNDYPGKIYTAFTTNVLLILDKQKVN